MGKSKKQPIFISADRDFVTGKEALKKIKEKGDSKYFDPNQGVLLVPKERWQEAQEFESKTWSRDFSNAKDDSNRPHFKHFDEYAYLKGRVFEKAIELGCGPFTNMRYIARECAIKEIHLLDPLLDEYLKHPNCFYGGGKLKVMGGIWPRRVPVITHSVPIEDFSILEKFDLAVLINVIEHCFDLDRIFDKILEITRNNAHIVFYDRYLYPEELKNIMETRYDAGHPLHVSGEVLSDFLTTHFSTLLYKINYVPHIKRGVDMSYYGLYYIGYRK